MTTTMTTPAAACRSFTCLPPAWLQNALSDIDQRVHSLCASQQPEKETSETFGERAENYYQKRPQLLSLLHDLHSRYLHLADRYVQSLTKSLPYSDVDADSNLSDAESSLSFQIPDTCVGGGVLDPTAVAIVIALVERDVAVDISETDWQRKQKEWLKKVDLQRSLVDVLESERAILDAENARLAFRASAAEEEGRRLAAEVGYVRKKAGELARYVRRLREEQRACVIGRRIEGLERQVMGMKRREEEVERLREENRRLNAAAACRRGTGKGWWRKGWCFADACLKL